MIQSFKLSCVNNPFRHIKSLLEPALELIEFVVSPNRDGNSIISIKIIMESFDISAVFLLKGQYQIKTQSSLNSILMSAFMVFPVTQSKEGYKQCIYFMSMSLLLMALYY